MYGGIKKVSYEIRKDCSVSVRTPFEGIVVVRAQNSGYKEKSNAISYRLGKEKTIVSAFPIKDDMEVLQGIFYPVDGILCVGSKTPPIQLRGCKAEPYLNSVQCFKVFPSPPLPQKCLRFSTYGSIKYAYARPAKIL